MRTLCLVLAMFTVLFISGCAAPSPQEVRKSGATLLYDVLLEVDPATAKKDAQFISTAMSTDIIPFVTNSQLPAAQLIPQLRKMLGEKIAGQKYVGAILGIVSMATSFGNIDIPAPKMSDTERAYVLAALQAAQDACDAFLTGKSVHLKLFKGGSCNANSSICVLGKNDLLKPKSGCTNCGKQSVKTETVVQDENGKVVGRPAGSGRFIINGVEYLQVDSSVDPDAVVDGKPYCQVSRFR